PVRGDGVLADSAGACVRRARVPVVAVRRDAARLAAGDRRVDAPAQRIAAVGRARVAVVAVERRARRAAPALAGLVAVADRGVDTRGAVRDGGVLAAGGRVAEVGRARVEVVAVERRPGGTGAALARLGAVADVRVGAGRVVRDRRVRAPGDRIAGVRRARVAVVAVETGAGRAEPVLTGLRAVADVVVGARRPVEDRHVLAAGLRVARVGRARVAVVAVERRPGGADAARARL